MTGEPAVGAGTVSLPLPQSDPLAPVRADLASFPGRWRESLYVAVGTTAALIVTMALQAPTWIAPAMAASALQTRTVCTWHNMCVRIGLAAVSAIVILPVAGVLIQLPWLLLPFFFLVVTIVSYVSPLSNRPLEALAMLLVSVTALYSGVFDPYGMPTAVSHVVYGYAIGLVTATVFAQLRADKRPSARLARALESGFGRARARLDQVARQYTSEQGQVPEGEAPLSSQFGTDIQLLDMVRQEGLSAGDVAYLGTLVIVVERIFSYIDTIDSLSRQPVGRTYRRLIAPEVAAVVAAIDTGLRGYQDDVRGFLPGMASADAGPDSWPDYRSLIAALQARQPALRPSKELAAIDLAEGANTNAFVEALVAGADILHPTPKEMRTITIDDAESPTSSLLDSIIHPNRYAGRYAMQVGLGTTISYLIGIVAQAPVLLTVLWNPIFIAQSSYGATIQRGSSRFGGVVLGCVLALLATVLVMPNISQLPALAVLMFLVTLPCQYIALGSSSFAYVGFQAVFSFAVVVVSAQPMNDVHAALWRVYGTLLGTAALFLVFRFVAPDYAGRQIIARFADVIRAAITCVPPPEATPPTLKQMLAARREVAVAVPNILRLADEARVEGRSGIDPAEAIHAAGRALRIAYRLGIVRRNRLLAEWPPLSAPMQAALDDVEAAVRARLQINLEFLQARHTMARPGSRPHRDACATAVTVAGRARPDITAPLDTFRARIDVARFGELVTWPPAATAALFAEVEHLRRIAELMPMLDGYLVRMCLPGTTAQMVGAVTAAPVAAPA